jgi:cell division transport system permease protein
MRINFVYYTKEAVESFRKNWIMSIAAVTTVALTLFIVGVFVLVAIFGNAALKKIEGMVGVVEIFLKDSATPQQIQAFQTKISKWREVGDLHYVSKDEAWKRLQEDLKDSPEMLEAVSENPLPASLRIKLKDPHTVNKIVKRLEKDPEIKTVVEDVKKDIKYGRGVTTRLFTVTYVLRLGGIAIIVLLCFASLVLIVNTIRLAIFARRKEVAVMKLVGASNWFIRWPFLLEGIYEGLLGSLLVAIILFLVKTPLIAWLVGFLRWLNVFQSSQNLQNQYFMLLIFLLGAGVVIGAAGSSIALRQYLKV